MLTGVLNGWLHNMLAMKGEIHTMLMNVIDWSHRDMNHQTTLRHIHLCREWSPHQSALHLMNNIQTTFAIKIGGSKIRGLDCKGLVFQGDGSLYISNPVTYLNEVHLKSKGKMGKSSPKSGPRL